jgi:hypothetical protein
MRKRYHLTIHEGTAGQSDYVELFDGVVWGTEQVTVATDGIRYVLNMQNDNDETPPRVRELLASGQGLTSTWRALD